MMYLLQTLYMMQRELSHILCELELDPKVKVKCQIINFLVNVSPLYSLDIAPSTLQVYRSHRILGNT